MNRLLLCALLLLPGAAFGQQSFAGSYVYQSPQGPVRLVLQQQGNAVTGTLRGADGGSFQLQGSLYEQGATGRIRIGEGVGFFAVGFVDHQLKLIVAEIDPATGQPDLGNGWNLDFTRVADAAGSDQPAGADVVPPGQPGTQQPGAQRQSARAPGAQPTGAGLPTGAQIDPVIVGLWGYTETYSSGDFFANTRYQLRVDPDGTYLYGRGNVSLGGAYIGNTGRPQGADPGQWRTHDNIIYILEEGSPQWQPYARYYVEGSSMMLTLTDGKRQVWHRQ
jgi:hypothetical protein